MLTINKLLPGARGLAPVLLRRAARVALGWDVRQKSRFDAVDSTGRAFGVFLPRGSVVRGGDALVAEDGSLILVEAAPQPVMIVTACAAHGTPFDLTRAAYHLGNRHVPLELRPDRLKFEPDHVLAAMLRRLHLIVTEADEAFDPESGAYAAAEGAGGHGHGHGHAAGGHDHEHDHDHGRQDPSRTGVDPAPEGRSQADHAHADRAHPQHAHAHDDHGHDPAAHDHPHPH